jgi:2-keto-4-pentenoate hydratase/2-oxohepta-3-ene-1,7-dioic acid hydratase in catechol pathway
MRLATYQHVTDQRPGGPLRISLVENGAIADLAALSPELPCDMVALLALGAAGLADIRRLRERAVAPKWIPLESVRLRAPVPRPPTYLGVGLNYREHAKEAGLALPTAPLIFNKQTSCISGPYDDVMLPQGSRQLDFEGELGIVIGQATRNMSPSQAAAAIAGYVIANDFSVRDWQLSSPTHTLGKSFDTHGPFGPWLVTADEILDPQTLTLTTTVDGHRRQHSSTADMIFSCLDIVRFLSNFMTLLPGTVITTGTPAGVCFGQRPPMYLQSGSLVRVEISHIGALANRVIAESNEATP